MIADVEAGTAAKETQVSITRIARNISIVYRVSWLKVFLELVSLELGTVTLRGCLQHLSVLSAPGLIYIRA